ncbi:hypothetical protein AX17_006406 [Amanita inopinata Kibby_2008]|nr:hypothetical protein AX17_006406 [Amanita inopinata Kibby_2008]
MHSLFASRSIHAATTSTTRGATMAVSRLVRCKYTSTSTMHDNDPELLEIEKQRNLSGSQHRTSTPLASAPGWNEYLASESEASVKADRSPDSLDDMAEATVQYVRARHNPDERAESTEAGYARDEVTGPLSGAKGKEDPNDVDIVLDRTPTIEAFSAGADTVVRETVTEDVTEVKEKKTITREKPAEQPTPSEEAVRAEQGKQIIG